MDRAGAKFVEGHSWPLAKMNLVIGGIEAQIAHGRIFHACGALWVSGFDKVAAT